MKRITKLFLLTLFMAITTVGCQQEKKQQVFTESDLVGTWQGDFELSWKKSKADFLKDTLRGADAYPKDPAEKEKVVREELKPVITGMIYTIKKDGSFNVDVAGTKSDGEYSIDKNSDNQMEITFKAKADPMMKDAKDKVIETKMDITFLSPKTIEILYNDVVIVFARQ